MAARGHYVFPIDDKNHRVLVIWDLKGYGEYEFDRCICDKVMACTSVGVRRWRRKQQRRRRRRRRRRNQNHNITEIFKFRGYNYINVYYKLDYHCWTICLLNYIYYWYLKQSVQGVSKCARDSNSHMKRTT